MLGYVRPPRPPGLPLTRGGCCGAGAGAVSAAGWLGSALLVWPRLGSAAAAGRPLPPPYIAAGAGGAEAGGAGHAASTPLARVPRCPPLLPAGAGPAPGSPPGAAWQRGWPERALGAVLRAVAGASGGCEGTESVWAAPRRGAGVGGSGLGCSRLVGSVKLRVFLLPLLTARQVKRVSASTTEMLRCEGVC